jgi:hypothetical protein
MYNNQPDNCSKEKQQQRLRPPFADGGGVYENEETESCKSNDECCMHNQSETV